MAYLMQELLTSATSCAIFFDARSRNLTCGKMKFKTFTRFSTGLVLGVSAGLVSSGAEGRPKPNVVWLIAEDLSPDIACYGASLVKTPNIDRLAAEGVRFTRAFASCPVCSPTRSAFNTGMYQTSVGAHNHRTTGRQPLPDGILLVSEHFRNAGYFVCNGNGNPGSKPGKTDFNYAVDHPFDGTDWSQRKAGQPFFAQVQFRWTHRDFKKDTENPVDWRLVELPPYYADHPVIRKDWALYLETVQALDREVGAVMKRLETEGTLDNTIVIFFGDHGRPHIRDKQFLYDGGIHVPMIVRFPGKKQAGTVSEALFSLIDLAPSSLALAGLPIPVNMEGLPLLTDKKARRDFIVAARDRCDETVDRIRCIRDRQFKYIRNFYPERPYTQFNSYKERTYPALPVMRKLDQEGKLTPVQSLFFARQRPEEELYELSADPFEVNNLAADPQYAGTVLKYRQLLEEWMEATGDRGSEPEPDELLQEMQQQAHEQWKTRMKARGLPENCSPDQLIDWWEQALDNWESTKK